MDKKLLIDRAARDKAALALRRYATNKITNYQLENSFEFSDDPAIWMIEQEAWYLYHDLKEHKAGATLSSEEARRSVAEMVVFLKSDQEYVFPTGGYPRRSLYSLILSLLTFGWSEKKRVKKKSFWDECGDIKAWPF